MCFYVCILACYLFTYFMCLLSLTVILSPGDIKYLLYIYLPVLFCLNIPCIGIAQISFLLLVLSSRSHLMCLECMHEEAESIEGCFLTTQSLPLAQYPLEDMWLCSFIKQHLFCVCYWSLWLSLWLDQQYIIKLEFLLVFCKLKL